MSYTLTIDETDKLCFVMGRLHGRPNVPNFAVRGPELDPTVVVCLHTATDGSQSLILCIAEADFTACKTLAGSVQFFRAFRSLVVEMYPDTASLFNA